MNCFTSGIVGIGLLGATFATMSVPEKQKNMLIQKIGPELTDTYNKIVIERRNQYFQGLILGFVLSFFLLKLFSTKNVFHRISFVLAVSMAVSVLYYLLMPKSDYMLNHLMTPEQNKAWLEVYKTMKQRYVLGFLFCLLAAIPIAYAFC